MSADWFEGVASYWSKQRDDGQPDLIFTEDEIDDWPPLVALRAEVVRLTELAAVEPWRAEPLSRPMVAALAAGWVGHAAVIVAITLAVAR